MNFSHKVNSLKFNIKQLSNYVTYSALPRSPLPGLARSLTLMIPKSKHRYITATK